MSKRQFLRNEGIGTFLSIFLLLTSGVVSDAGAQFLCADGSLSCELKKADEDCSKGVLECQKENARLYNKMRETLKHVHDLIQKEQILNGAFCGTTDIVVCGDMREPPNGLSTCETRTKSDTLGYAKASDLCKVVEGCGGYARICTVDEVKTLQEEDLQAASTAAGWVSNGRNRPSFMDKDDCFGFTEPTDTGEGVRHDGLSWNGSQFHPINCHTAHKIMCCGSKTPGRKQQSDLS